VPLVLGVLALAALLPARAQTAADPARSSAVSDPGLIPAQAAPQSAAPQKPDPKKPAGPEEAEPSPPSWFDRISLTGFLSGDGRWRRAGDGPSVSTTTDLYLRAFELGVEANIAGWLSATAVLNSEYVGDPLNAGDARVLVDEAHLDITVPHTPLYFVIGKRIQPFGLFETYLATDLLVQDAYETKAVGLTAGIQATGETDLSFTAYKGRVRGDHLAASALLGPDVPDLPAIDVPRANSWIVSGISSPLGDDWRVSAAFASEPGAVRRATTLNVGSYLSFPFYEHIDFTAEYMKALRRDDVPGLGTSFLEQALSFTASYQVVTQEMKETAGRNYRGRKSRRLAHPTVVALRFEALDDGGRAAALGTWSVRHRMSAGGRYTFYEAGNVEAALTLEYRRQTVRASPLFAGPVPATHEVYFRFGLDF
jgi:hypothetical protein